MTYERLCSLPFQFEFHVILDGVSSFTYRCADPAHRGIYYCDHQPYKDGPNKEMVPKGHRYRHWKINGKLCKTMKKVIAAIKDL